MSHTGTEVTKEKFYRQHKILNNNWVIICRQAGCRCRQGQAEEEHRDTTSTSEDEDE